ncbi:MAG: UDP-N-acetylglucosamine diphosphorylase [Oscillospiraceae bacterium]|nr:UDP-N-acetylglucosamine diphosphorylase [Oscillospiraceae bacterium]
MKGFGSIEELHEYDKKRIEVIGNHMKCGVLFSSLDADIADDVKIGAGTVIHSGTVIGAGCVIGENCEIGPNSVITVSKIGDGVSVNSSKVSDSEVGAGTTVGPFSHLRNGCKVGEKCRIGNFVELKNATLDNGSKVSHLSYIGDASLGKNVNMGCGSITVNYDGVGKYRTEIGDNAFVGCNVNLIAPVKVGEGALVAAGSTITDEVPVDALAIARARQTVKEDRASKIFEANRRKKNG